MELDGAGQVETEPWPILKMDGTDPRSIRKAFRCASVALDTLEAASRTLSLVPTATGWRVEGQIDLGHDWNVQLRPADGTWRLQGRWPAGQQATYLRPALGSE